MRPWFWVIVLPAGCGGGKCDEEGVRQCHGDVLEVCADGEFVDERDCAEEGLVCDEDAVHCMTTAE